MKKRFLPALIIGKCVRQLSRFLGNGGSALPGLIIEKIAPNFLSEALKDLPGGVIVVVGTNGKTTTTKVITELLAAQDKRVLTNSTGSNFTRGIVAAIVNEYSFRDKSLNKDLAVLELDEAYGGHFVKRVKPKYVIALNVMRDQLDRFGELEVTTQLLASILQASTDGCVINGDEPALVTIGEHMHIPVAYYGVKSDLLRLFPTDAELLKLADGSERHNRKPFAVTLESFQDQVVSYKIDDHVYDVRLKLKGQYNFHNAAAALAGVAMVMPEVKVSGWLKALQSVEPAFGRGEVIEIGDRKVELMLVKNPSGFRQVLASHDSEALTMIAINDNYSDGRDVSWLWDVDFTKYSSQIYIASGIRANDLALRLQYDNIKINQIEPNLGMALLSLLDASSILPRRIFCTYTAMLAIRSHLGKLTVIEPGI